MNDSILFVGIVVNKIIKLININNAKITLSVLKWKAAIATYAVKVIINKMMFIFLNLSNDLKITSSVIGANITPNKIVSRRVNPNTM